MIEIKACAIEPAVPKPEWEYGGTFDAAWAGVRLTPVDDDQKQLMWKSLAQAHVVTIDRAQLDAIPDMPVSSITEMNSAVLPFPALYVSVSGPQKDGFNDRLGGFLIETEAPGLSIATFWRFNPPRRRTVVVPVVAASVRDDDHINLWHHFIWSEEASLSVATADIERSLALVGFLESVNVELDETPVSRQVRRAAARRGAPIALRVYVRPPKHRRDGGGIGDRIEFSHRFEVRGHYKHYGPGTRFYHATERDKPAKILDHPTRGPVVRIWCPPFVKGPEDKPLIPKVRAVTKVVS